ncbi:MAG: flagellar hook-basal body complex protein FliE [Acidobacteriota bacterium]
MNISLSALSGSLPQLTGAAAAAAGGGGFADAIASAIGQVETAQATAKAAANDLLLGGKGDIHSVALASQRAALSVELFQQVRNKFVSAYQEIMRMPM